MASASSWPALTTDADKAKTCCQYSGIVSMPAEWTTAYNTIMLQGTYGGPKNIFEYSKTCNRNFPSTIDGYNTNAKNAITKYASNSDSGPYEFTYDSKTGIAKYGKQSGDYESKAYCDGGAATLVAATTAAFAVTISLY